jgi:hypothetical protein
MAKYLSASKARNTLSTTYSIFKTLLIKLGEMSSIESNQLPEGTLHYVTGIQDGVEFCSFFVVVDRIVVMAQDPLKPLKGHGGQYALDYLLTHDWKINKVNKI